MLRRRGHVLNLMVPDQGGDLQVGKGQGLALRDLGQAVRVQREDVVERAHEAAAGLTFLDDGDQEVLERGDHEEAGFAARHREID